MTLQSPLYDRDRSQVELIGSYVEVRWTATHRMAKRQCEKCVYLIRGIAPGLICVELVYDAIDGEHRHDNLYWVPMDSIQTMKVLTDRSAAFRIENLERETFEEMPRD
jgi:hypothetical protein